MIIDLLSLQGWGKPQTNYHGRLKLYFFILIFFLKKWGAHQGRLHNGGAPAKDASTGGGASLVGAPLFCEFFFFKIGRRPLWTLHRWWSVDGGLLPIFFLKNFRKVKQRRRGCGATTVVLCRWWCSGVTAEVRRRRRWRCSSGVSFVNLFGFKKKTL